MTDPEDLRPADIEEAAEIIRQDPALQTATDRSGEEDAATDDDARTSDTAQTGESRN
jgi:hypothetical protein